jgi:hypothetical protein
MESEEEEACYNPNPGQVREQKWENFSVFPRSLLDYLQRVGDYPDPALCSQPGTRHAQVSYRPVRCRLSNPIPHHDTSLSP